MYSLKYEYRYISLIRKGTKAVYDNSLKNETTDAYFAIPLDWQ